MAFGVLSRTKNTRRRARPLRGLGVVALGADIPANCWDAAGFKDCNAQGWNIAETKCRVNGQPTDLANQTYGGDVDACKQAQADDYAYYGCVLRICPPPAPKHPTSSTTNGITWSWMNSTPNPSVLAFQQHLNTALQADGYKTITADGRLGPATCGAFNFVGGANPDLFANDPIANIGVCQAFTNPTLVGSSTPVPSPTNAEAQQLDQQYGGLPWMATDPRMPALQQQINISLAANGFMPIQVTGMLDPATCGAMYWLDQNTGSQLLATWGPKGGGACPSMLMPVPNPKGPGPAPAPAPGPSPLAPTSSSGFAAVGIGLLAAVAAGGYAWYKHKAGA